MGTATVDIETFHKLNGGTKFQQDLNLLTIMSNIMEEEQLVELNALNLEPKEYQRALKVCALLRANYLLQNPPPNVDIETLRLFCE